MPVGIGLGRIEDRSGKGEEPCGFARVRVLHPGALWLAAAAPVVATLLLVARLAA